MSNKVTKKQIRANEALEKRKYQRRLSKANPNVQITADVVNEQISVSHVDRIQNMLPPGIKIHQPNFPKRRKFDLKSILPYTPLKKFVHWLPVNQQDVGSTVSLTKEIEEFSKYVSLDQNEIDSRENMLRELHETIMSKWSNAEIHQFGSYAVGLSTFMSDLDISIMNMGVDNEPTSALPVIQKPDNHIIQTQVVSSSSSGLAQLQANTFKGSRTLIKIDDSDVEHEVVDLTGVDLVKAKGSAAKRKREQSDDESEDKNEVEETISDTDSDYRNSNYNVTAASSSSMALKRAKATADMVEKYQQQVVDLVSSSSSSEDDSDEEEEDGVKWKIDTDRPNEVKNTQVENEATGTQEADAASGVAVDDDGHDDEYESSSSDDSRDSRYDEVSQSADGGGFNEDSMTEADLAELNRLYEAEERAMADIDDDLDDFEGEREVRGGRRIDIGSINDDSSSVLSEEEGDEDDEGLALIKTVLSGTGRPRRKDDDSYYSEGDVYNRHTQNELFRTIKTRINSSGDLAEDDDLTETQEEKKAGDGEEDEAEESEAEKEESEESESEEDIEGSSSSCESDNDSLTKLLLMSHTDQDSSSSEESEEEEDESVEADLEHSLIVGGAGGGGATKNGVMVPSSRMSFQSSSSTTAVVDKEAELLRHRKQLNLLRTLFPHLRSMNWLAFLELRSRARVPIINLQHKNSIECDISMGVSAQDTSHIVQELKEFCGAALLALSSFLKVFLNQMDLDKLFSGGLGSYKLYVIIAAHIEKNQKFIEDKLKPDLGSLLLSFLKYYGNPRNLNGATTVRVLSAEVCFDRTNRVGELQKLFEAANDVLGKIVQRRLVQGKTAALVSSSNSKSSNQALIIKPGAGGSDATHQLQQLYSSSALAALLNVEDLCHIRAKYRNKCRDYPLLREEDLVSMAQKIVDDLERRLAFPKGLTVEEIERINPCLYARLRSFSSVEAAVRHLGSRDSTFAPSCGASHFTNGGGGGAHGGFPRTKSVPVMAFGGGNRSKEFGRNSIPAGEYKFSFNGVVGNSITDLPHATNSRVSRNKAKPTRGGSEKPSRHSFGGFINSPNGVLGKRQHQQGASDYRDGKKFKGNAHKNSGSDDQPIVIPNRYNNTKSGFSFSNGNYKIPPPAGAASAVVTSAVSAAKKVEIAFAAKKLSNKINDSISELKNNIAKTKNNMNGGGKKTS